MISVSGARLAFEIFDLAADERGGGLAPFGILGFGTRLPNPSSGDGVSIGSDGRLRCAGVCIFAFRTISWSGGMPMLSLANVKSPISRSWSFRKYATISALVRNFLPFGVW